MSQKLLYLIRASRLNYLLLLLILPFLNSYAQTPSSYKNGMVVTAHPVASQVGIDILKKGGNAVDAAIAVQFALAVVYPNAGNIGGGGFMVYRSSKNEVSTLDFRETAPGKATKDMYLDESGNPIERLSLDGQLSVGTPGTVDGMVRAHQKYAKLTWKELLQPAIDLARKGFSITAMQAEELNSRKEIFQRFNPLGTALIKKKDEWKEGDILQQKELARTLSLIKEKGRAGFYEGRTAHLLLEEMKRGNGIISYQDLKNYQAKWRKPIVGNYRGYEVISMPPSSSGGIALISLLKAVEPYPLKRWGFQRDSTIQLIVEAERRVYADRAEHLGDADFYKVPLRGLLEPTYLLNRMKDINFNKATPSSEVKAGKPNIYESEQTTHFSIVDKEGNAVAITTTLNNSYGSQVVVKGAGFLLNDEMDDFSIKPGVPNLYGLLGGTANAIEPGKRMLSAMSPTIVTKNNNLFMVLGTPGGSTIITSVLQTILNVVDFQMEIQQAVDAPRFHHQWMPDEIFVEEKAIDNSVRSNLENKGYKITPRSSIGRVDAILVNQDGSLIGGADVRGDDKAIGY